MKYISIELNRRTIGSFTDEELKELAHSLDENAPMRDDPRIMRKVLSGIFASIIE